jgi:hypothetical protein
MQEFLTLWARDQVQPCRKRQVVGAKAVRSEVELMAIGQNCRIDFMQGANVTEIIAFVLGNFTLTFLVIGLVFSAATLACTTGPLTTPGVIEALFKWFLFFSIGVSNLYNAVMHTVFAATAAAYIGWANSPFQYEVGFASLGFAAVGFLATWRSLDMRFAAILGPAFFVWGAAGGHVYQMVTAHNFAPGNAGVIFWTDVLLPAIGFALLWLQYHYQAYQKSHRSPAF